MLISPRLLTADTVMAPVSGTPTPFPIRLWDYGSDDEPLSEVALIVHGRRGLPPDRSQDVGDLYPRLAALADQLTAQGQRVLLLDWGEAAVDSLPPFDAAGRIKAIADWATGTLQALNLEALTLIGHSLGSYVAAQTAQSLSSRVDPSIRLEGLIALDPAFPAQNYDIDGLTAGRQAVPSFAQGDASLAFVAEDDIFQTGLAGDNDQAATANTSFVVDLAGLRGLGDAATAHGAVIEVYQDFERYLEPGRQATAWVLDQFPADRVNNQGRFTSSGQHNGIAEAAREDGAWRISRVVGDGVVLHTVVQADEIDLAGADAQVDIVASLVDLTLAGDLEHLVFGGEANLEGSGNGLDNRLYGNRGDNRLVGRAGSDQLYGATGDDRLLGNRGDDRLVGQGGDDDLMGNLGRDRLMGGQGADRLVGGAGSDRLIGGTGRDWLRGGGGQDWFVLENGTDDWDIVQDFQDGQDRFILPSGVAVDSVQALGLGEATLLAVAGQAIAVVSNTAASQIDPADFAEV